MALDVGDVEDERLIVEQVEIDAAARERLEQQLLLDADAAIEDADAHLLAPVLFFFRRQRERERLERGDLEVGAAVRGTG